MRCLGWLKNNWSLIAIFLLLWILCYLFPYAGDDWAWGSFIGMDRLSSGFDNYGGRYLGYMIVMVMTRFRILRALIMAGTMMGIGICVKKIVKHEWAFYVSIVSMFLMAVDIFAQSISWVSGFANYTTTALLVLIFLIFVMNGVLQNKKESLTMMILMPLIGLGGCLVMENVSLYFVLMPIGIQLYLWKKEKRFSLPLFLFFLGAVIGSGLMFANSAYHNIAIQQDDYRAVESSPIGITQKMISNYLENIHLYTIFKNVILDISFVMASVFLLILNKKLRTKIPVISLMVSGALVMFVIVDNLMIGEAVSKPMSMIYFEAGVSLLLLFTFLVFSLLTSEKKTELRKKYVLLWATFFVLIAPLFVVSPIGPRNFFGPYMILVVINLLEWQTIFEEMKEKHKKLFEMVAPVMKKVVLMVTFSVIFIMIGIFGMVYCADKNRRAQLWEDINQGQQVVELHHLPFEKLMWSATPENEIFNERYKIFYGIPKDIELVVKP